MSGRTFNPWRVFVGSFLPNWLASRSEITPGAKLCYARLCQFAGKAGVAYPSQQDLATELGVCARQVKRYYRELLTVQVAGQPAPLISCQRVYGGKVSRVTFLLHPWMQLDRPVDELWKTEPVGTSTSPPKGTPTSPPIGSKRLKTLEAEAPRLRRGRPAAPAPLSHAKGKGKAGQLVAELARDLSMPGAEQPGLKRGELDAVRVRIESLSPGERTKLTGFVAWLARHHTTPDLIRAIVADLVSRGDVDNPFAYYAKGSEARERLRRASS